MNESANSSNGEEHDVVVGLEQVCDRELNEISMRRERAFDRKDDEPVIRNSLIGLALSGGGVRSAAFSLGILQGLHRHGVLPFIDYLSTVSGGGYAGAFLSSAALHPQPTNSDGTESEALFPIAEVDGQQSPRMLRFIHGGRYLRKTWVFINRYLAGLFLIWLVVFSGLMAAAAFVTYAFRMLDRPTSIEWISALGFQGDLLRAFCPSFILFGLWALFWGVSYFKFGRYASGNVARFFFCLLVASILVALAALLGTGDISLSGGSSNKFSSTFKTLVVGTIAASLLPYLTPQRLIRSGTNPKNVGERYVFWLTTRALAYGVPFLFVAFFARENISHFNDYRDARLVRTDVRKWDTSSPMWTPLVTGKPVESGNLWASLMTFEHPVANEELSRLVQDNAGIKKFISLDKETPGSSALQRYEIPKQVAKLSLRDLELLQRELASLLSRGSEAGVELDDAGKRQIEVSGVLQMIVDLRLQEKASLLVAARKVDSDKLHKGPDGDFDETDAFVRPKQYAEISLLNRWWHFFAYMGERTVGDDSEASGNVFGKIVEGGLAGRSAKDRTIEALNRELAKSNFYDKFLPPEIFEHEAATEATKTTKYTNAVAAEPPQEANGAVAAESPTAANESLAASAPKDMRFRELELTEEFSGKPTQELTISEKVTKDTVSTLAATAFERVRESHPGSGAEDWLRTLRSLRKQAKRNEDRTSAAVNASKLAGPNGLQAAVAAESARRSNYAINYQILRAYYGDAINDDRTKVYASVVLAEDQRTRWNWFVGSTIVFLIAAAFVDLNATSWHGFYSQRIASMWIEKTAGLTNGLPLAQLETSKVGRPYHLLSGAVHVRRMHDGAEYTTKRDRFLFSKLFCGSESTGYVATGQYMNGEYTLEDAVAISGAAVSPIQTDNPLIIALLFLSNIRLGQWVLNPAHKTIFPKSIQRFARTLPFTPLRYLYNRLQSIEERSFCFVTDGGHYENLGIESLLKRRCRLIIASDAGQDSDFVFADLTRLIRSAKLENGITFVPLGREELPLELEALIPDATTRLSRRQFVLLKIRYPEPGAPCGYLAYLKPTMTGDETFELQQFHRTQDNFPHDPTSDQFYDAARFDSYRALGLHIISELCAPMKQAEGSNVANTDSGQFIDRFVQSFGFREEAPADATTEASQPAGQVRQLLAELRLPDAAKHESACQQLERLGVASFAAMPDLLGALSDEHWYVKLSVQRLLYEHPREALPHLIEVLDNDDDWELQIAAADVIWEYGNGPYRALDLSSAIAPLIRLSGSTQAAARVAAARSLAVVGKGDPEAQRVLGFGTLQS